MGFAGVGSPHDNEVCVLHLAIGTGPPAHSKDCRQTDDAGSVSSSVAAIDVVAVHHHASELLRHIVHLVGGFRTTEKPERVASVCGFCLPKTLCSAVERLVPSRRAKRAIVADKRGREAGTVGFHSNTPVFMDHTRGEKILAGETEGSDADLTERIRYDDARRTYVCPSNQLETHAKHTYSSHRRGKGGRR